ncbi:SigE family RNA polymerase sigma factor [Arsenicicoccus dermatophilus]|uniref:SigE family RNA polymerase sigma factor n=1 Tax=Arsenicicoccus dermatophilus TaxID=1076331 RepID=UPI001F4C82BB|nr:SigE family RNA polymerase sigma factor [Arsenicicoccus dermatophilus]MCH8611947.1 SigE family RNA polymerase sigma factor [Arsenicicoccus dermatophilus]
MRPVPPEFEEFVRHRRAGLVATATLLLGDQGRAEDAVQETLVRVAERWEQATRDGTPGGYAHTALVRRCIDTRRWWQRRPEWSVEHLPEIPCPTGDVDRSLLLRAALLRLTPHQRAVVVLRYLDDLTEVRTAEVLGCSPSTVKSQTRVALQRLRELAPELSDLVPTGGPS